MIYVITILFISFLALRFLTDKFIFNVQHVKVLDGRKLEVFPAGDKNKLHFELQWLKNKLPTVVVKVTT